MDRLPLSEWLRQVEETIRRRRVLPERAPILVAVSGGLDSMVLLHALHQLAPRHKWQLRVAHFNHQLRGADSDADESLVRRVAEKLGLPFVAGRGDVAADASANGVSLEMAARRLRHRFLAASARKARVARIALAHHADDQVELFFVRLLRGAGSQGLAGMKWSNLSPENKKITLVRPLLDQTKAALLAAAREAGLEYSEDSTNASLDIFRNRVRQELIPLLQRRYQPRLRETILRAMELAGAEAAAIDDLARAADGSLFDTLPVAVQRRLLQQQLHQGGARPDFALIERLRLFAEQPLPLDSQRTVARGRDGLLHWAAIERFAFAKARRWVELAGKPGRVLFADKEIAWDYAADRGSGGAEYFDADRVGASICLRHWQPGDRFHAIGARASAKVQDLFTNLKIARAERHRRVVAATAGGELFWVEGLRIGERFKVTPSTRRILEWRSGRAK